MKTFQEFQKDLHEVAPALLAAPLLLPALTFAAGAGANYLKGVYQAKRQGEGGRSQPVDYGQGGTTKPRTPNVQRGRLSSNDAYNRQKKEERKAEAQRRAREKAEQGIDELIGSDAERKAAAEARARARENQPQVQQRLRKEAEAEKARQKENRRAEMRRRMENAARELERADMRRRMNQAADKLGLD